MGCWSWLESSRCTSSGSPGHGLATALPPPPARSSITFHSTRPYQEEASASPALPQLLPHTGPSPVGLFYSTPPQGPGTWPMKEASVSRITTLQSSHLTIKAGPFCAESLPDRQHHQSSIRHGIKMGHTPSMRPGYGNTPLPQLYRVSMRAKPGPPLQLLVGDPLPRATPPKHRVEDPKMKPSPGRKAAAGQPYTAAMGHNTPSCKSNSSTTISLQAEPHHPSTQPPRRGTFTTSPPCTIYHQSLSATFLLPGLRR